jgi:NADH:ubiquinone oxidoreductase subunit B-like Fe-S oxidoreductase
VGAGPLGVAGHLRPGLLRDRADDDRRPAARPGQVRHGEDRVHAAGVAGRVSQKMAPVLRQIYDQMPEPKWVISMGVCASSGGMFNNYAIVQGVDHVVPVDIYLPGCPPRPEMLMDSIFKLHDKIMNMKLGADRDEEITELEEARLKLLPLHVTPAVNEAGSEL